MFKWFFLVSVSAELFLKKETKRHKNLFRLSDDIARVHKKHIQLVQFLFTNPHLFFANVLGHVLLERTNQ
jgi:hypothetical protein